jgi:Luciferase-like monooxygenase
MWAPEHSHIPVPRKTPFPGGGELPKPYYVLSAAAVVTKTLKLATGVCLVVQRDPIQTAKLVASIDPGLGRPVFVRGGWRLEPRGDRGPRRRLRDPLLIDARGHRGDEGDLDQGHGGSITASS